MVSRPVVSKATRARASSRYVALRCRSPLPAQHGLLNRETATLCYAVLTRYRGHGSACSVSVVAREAAWSPGSEAPAHLDGR